MGNKSAIDWLAIYATCPEFKLNIWVILMAVIAMTGCVLNTILHFRLRKKIGEGSAFLSTLAGFDFVICFMYLWVYSVTSFTTAYKSEFLAQLRIDTQISTKVFVAVYESAMTLILLFIILEKFLWTCTPRCRLKWKMFTLKTPKYWLFLGTILFATVSTVITYFKGLQLSTVPFCDVALRPIEYENSALHLLQRYIFPCVLLFATFLTGFYVFFTSLRLSLVGQGDQPVHQEEINLTGRTEQSPLITIAQVKRSIICMLVVAVTFLIRAAVYYMLIDSYTSSMYTKSMGDRHAIIWWYDSISVVFSASRFVVYYLICRNRMVFEYPLNGLGH